MQSIKTDTPADDGLSRRKMITTLGSALGGAIFLGATEGCDFEGARINLEHQKVDTKLLFKIEELGKLTSQMPGPVRSAALLAVTAVAINLTPSAVRDRYDLANSSAEASGILTSASFACNIPIDKVMVLAQSFDGSKSAQALLALAASFSPNLEEAQRELATTYSKQRGSVVGSAVAACGAVLPNISMEKVTELALHLAGTNVSSSMLALAAAATGEDIQQVNSIEARMPGDRISGALLTAAHLLHKTPTEDLTTLFQAAHENSRAAAILAFSASAKLLTPLDFVLMSAASVE